MSEWVLVIAAAVLTYASRAAVVVFLPVPTGRVRRFVDRLPAPLFAGLAVFALVGEEAAWPDPSAALAAAAAAAMAPLRSLPAALVAGSAGYAIGALVW